MTSEIESELKQEIIENIVYEFMKIENKITQDLKENQKTLSEEEAGRLFFHAIINYAGHFIYAHSSDKNQRSLNYKEFVLTLHKWLERLEEISEEINKEEEHLH